MRVTVDISDVQKHTALALEELRKTHDIMLNGARQGAIHEQVTHEYQNRTGNLQKSTKAVTISRSLSDVRVNLEMGMEYASYVKKSGLSNIDDAADIAEDAITAGLEASAERIAK